MPRLRAPPPPSAFELAHPKCVVHIPKQPPALKISDLEVIITREYGAFMTLVSYRPNKAKDRSVHIVFEEEEAAFKACIHELDVLQEKRRSSLRRPNRIKAYPGRQVLHCDITKGADLPQARPNIGPIQEIPLFGSVRLASAIQRPPSYFLEPSAANQTVHITNLPNRVSSCEVSKSAWIYGRNRSCVYQASNCLDFCAIILFDDPGCAAAATGKGLKIGIDYLPTRGSAIICTFVMSRGSGNIPMKDTDSTTSDQTASLYFPDPAIMEDIAALLFREEKASVVTSYDDEDCYPNHLRIPSYNSLHLSSLTLSTSSPSADPVLEASFRPVLPFTRHHTLSNISLATRQKRPRRSSLDEMSFFDDKKVRLDESLIAAESRKPALSASLELLDHYVATPLDDLTNTTINIDRATATSPGPATPETPRAFNLLPLPFTPNASNDYSLAPTSVSYFGLSPSNALSETSSLSPFSPYLQLLGNPYSPPSSAEPDDDSNDDSGVKGSDDDDTADFDNEGEDDEDLNQSDEGEAGSADYENGNNEDLDHNTDSDGSDGEGNDNDDDDEEGGENSLEENGGGGED